MSTNPAGYSGTPLAKKLGFVAGCTVWVVNPPADYQALVSPALPPGVEFAASLTDVTDIAHVFTDSKAVLHANLKSLRTAIKPNAAIWVSWPKKASKLPTEITEDTIRELALPLGLVDIKVCAVSEIWSGLKLVIRKELR